MEEGILKKPHQHGTETRNALRGTDLVTKKGRKTKNADKASLKPGAIEKKATWRKVFRKKETKRRSGQDAPMDVQKIVDIKSPRESNESTTKKRNQKRPESKGEEAEPNAMSHAPSRENHDEKKFNGQNSKSSQQIWVN